MEKVLVSGTSAIVVPKADATEDLSKSAVRKVFKAKGLKLEKLSKGEHKKPKAGVRFTGKGGG